MRSENNIERRINSALSESINEPQPVMDENQTQYIGSQVEGNGQELDYEMSEDRGPEVVQNNSNNIHVVNIEPLDSGFYVKVGCQRVAVESPEALLKALKAYYDNPSEFQSNWFKNKNINKLK